MLARLDEIYQCTEQAWSENATALAEGKVSAKYLLLAEAAPWPEQKEISYFYYNAKGSWCRSIWSAFFPNTPPPSTTGAFLAALREKGLLLVDTLPFALPYTSTMRRSPAYQDLIALSKSWFLSKLHDPRLSWAKAPRVAFAFKLNALAVMQAHPNGLVLPTEVSLPLGSDLIAANGSGFTSARRLREIFGLES